MLENQTDWIPPGFVHGSIFQVTNSPIANLYGKDSTALTRDYGNSHTEFDLRPEWRRIDKPLYWFGSSVERMADYAAAMEQATVSERARQIMIDGSPHTMIFPICSSRRSRSSCCSRCRWRRPSAVTAVQFRDARHQPPAAPAEPWSSVGPARPAAGRRHGDVRAQPPRREDPRPGMADADPGPASRAPRTRTATPSRTSTDEVPQRRIWRHYFKLMQE